MATEILSTLVLGALAYLGVRYALATMDPELIRLAGLFGMTALLGFPILAVVEYMKARK
jgi:uncharacterized membrane protein